MASGRKFSCRVFEACLLGANLPRKLKGAGQKLTTILSIIPLFCFKSAMAVNMNPVFEQDPTFPFYCSAEERAAFYSAKISRSDDKKG